MEAKRGGWRGKTEREKTRKRRLNFRLILIPDLVWGIEATDILLSKPQS